MNHASLFSGIGAPEVAAEMLGWRNVFHCEINPFGRAVLEYWFPDSDSYEDITKTDFTQYRGRVDVLTGGFPCQPFSYAGKRGGKKTHVTSGRKCSALLAKSGPLGSLVRTLLESPRWSKEGYSLIWEARPLCSVKRVMFTDSCLNNALPSNASATILNVQDIPSSRCLFLLRLRELPIDETGCSFLPMLQTPTTITRDERPEQMRARAERNGYKNGTKFNSLESQVKYDSRFTGLLPTPTVNDMKNATLPPSQGERHGGLSTTIINGMLPTPTARDYKNPSSPDGERIERKIREGYTIELNDLAPMGILPTPSARDWKGKTTPGVKKQGGQVYGEMLPDTIGRVMEASCQETAGGSFRLSPLFTEEMMGFPSLWTTLPFLKRSGETNL